MPLCMHYTMHSVAHLRSRTLVYPENEHSMFLRNVDVYIPNLFAYQRTITLISLFPLVHKHAFRHFTEMNYRLLGVDDTKIFYV